MQARNLIDLEDISKEDLDEIIRLAGMIKANPSIFTDACHGKIMATLFYEPSTRTQMSFQTAMLRLGGQIIGFDNPSNASVSKGESLKDTIRVVSGYADVIVMRNPVEGSALAASLYSKSPIINAGDGGHLHPTQTLTDLVTLSYEKGTLEGLTIGLCGDMKNGRTVHSLIKTLSKYKGNRFIMISTPQLQMPEYVIEVLKESGCDYSFSDSLEKSIADLDVLYMTRIQQERFASREEYEAQKGVYVLDEQKMKLAKPDLVVLHPLPRVDEITVGVDDDPRAKYFEGHSRPRCRVQTRDAAKIRAVSRTRKRMCRTCSMNTEERRSANSATAFWTNESAGFVRFTEAQQPHRKADGRIFERTFQIV